MVVFFVSTVAVGDRHDLRELVGDEEDALALLGEILHDRHQLVDLLRREHGGGLVENQDLVFAVEHLQDLGALLHADGDVLDLRVGVDLQAVAFGELQHLLARLLLLQEAVLVRLHAEDDVVEHREALDQLEVLVHHADAEVVCVVRVLDRDDLAVFFNDALLRLIQTEQDAHQRGLARAVLAEQRVDLALFQLQGDVVVRDDAGEPLGDVQHLNRVWCSQVSCPPFGLCRANRTRGHIYDYYTIRATAK